jgi:hypothetical protein
MAAITAAGLVGVYPEWVAANTNQPLVVAAAVDFANSKTFELFTSDEQDTQRRYLEAGLWLFEHPYGRDMLQTQPDAANHWEKIARKRDVHLGNANRGPGWEMPNGAT